MYIKHFFTEDSMSNLTLFDQQLKIKANPAHNANAGASQKNHKMHCQCQSLALRRQTHISGSKFER